jgi:hypothetical protein
MSPKFSIRVILNMFPAAFRYVAFVSQAKPSM